MDSGDLSFVPAPRGFPREVNILGQRWRVKYSPDLYGDRSLFGTAIPRDRLIIIDSGQQRDSMADTLLHEVLHAIIATSGASCKHEEQIVAALAPGLVHVLRSNRRFW